MFSILVFLFEYFMLKDGYIPVSLRVTLTTWFNNKDLLLNKNVQTIAVLFLLFLMSQIQFSNGRYKSENLARHCLLF